MSAAVPPTVARARAAVSVAFFIMGFVLGLWFVHIPVVASRLALEPAALGSALLAIGLGSLLFQPVAGFLVARIGSRRGAVAFLVALLTFVALAVHMPNVVALIAVLFVTGAAGGAFNVAINTQAAEIETALDRPAMSTFHGFFSLGALAAAGVGSVLFARGWGDGRGMLVASAILAPTAVAIGTLFLDHAGAAARRRYVLPGPALLPLVGLAVLCTTIEFSVNDWSTLFLTSGKGMSASEATLGFAMFSLAMATMRFAGSRAVKRVGEKAIVAGGGVLVTVGIAVALAAPPGIASAAGFLFVGIGAANLAPLLMSQASRMPGVEPSVGVAATGTGLTTGILLTPPLVGFVAQATSLYVALAMVGAFGLLIAVGAWNRDWRSVGGRQADAPSSPG